MSPIQPTRLGLACALVALGCLKAPPPGACPRFTPTGGDVVGKWEVLDICVDLPLEAVAGCPEFEYAQEAVSAAGSIEFGANGSYNDQTVLTQALRIEAPRRCFPSVATCADLAPTLAANDGKMTGATTERVQAFCSGKELCRCAVKMVTSTRETSTFTKDGNVIVQGDGRLEYTVLGNELRLQTDGIVIRLARP